MPLQKQQNPSRLTRWRDQMREKRNRDKIQNIQVRQLSQSEKKNLRADELASPPGSARVVVSVAKDTGRQIIDALIENQPLPSLKIDSTAIDGRMTIDVHNRRVIERNAPMPTSALNDGRAYAMVGLDYPPPVPEKDAPVGLGISNVDFPTFNNNSQTQPHPPKFPSKDSSSSTPHFAISHVIDCSKGLESTALLLSPSIRDECKTVLRAQREIEAAEGNLVHIVSLTGDLEVDIACLQDEIARGKIGKGKEKVRDSAASEEQQEDVSLDTLNSLLVEITAHRKNLAASLQAQREELLAMQNHLNAQLDEAFTTAKMLEPRGSVTQDEEVTRTVHFEEDDVQSPTLIDGWFVADAKQSAAPHIMPADEVEGWMHGVPEGAWAGDELEGRWQAYAKAISEGIIDDGGEVLESDSLSVQEQARRVW